jgi:hypothetical protein
VELGDEQALRIVRNQVLSRTGQSGLRRKEQRR